MVIEATGTVRKTIVQGAFAEVQVKYGLITLIKTKADLCEQVSNVDLECPIEAGNMTITKAVELPATIPSVRGPVPSKDPPSRRSMD